MLVGTDRLQDNEARRSTNLSGGAKSGKPGHDEARRGSGSETFSYVGVCYKQSPRNARVPGQRESRSRPDRGRNNLTRAANRGPVGTGARTGRIDEYPGERGCFRTERVGTGQELFPTRSQPKPGGNRGTSYERVIARRTGAAPTAIHTQ